MTFKEALEIGDEILMGKFRNKRAIIKDFGKDKYGQPTVKTDKGERNMYAFRVQKYMNGPSGNDKYHDFFKKMMDEEGVKSLNSLSKEEKRAFFKKVSKAWKEEKK
jgi:hypothetical protein